MKKIAILASGAGSNAEAIARYFDGREDVKVEMVVSNRRGAGVHERMLNYGIPTFTFPKQEWLSSASGGNDGSDVLTLFEESGIDMVILAGFLAYIPDAMIERYRSNIINIHPSLLPRHGGVGMWGMNVHEAVLADGDKESGITIHEVTSVVDGGKILFQASCPVEANDTPETLAQRVHALEHRYFPQVVDNLLTGRKVQ